MQTSSMPRCERCIDGGTVQLIETTDKDCSVFQPLPNGESGRSQFFQCDECGWTIPHTTAAMPTDRTGRNAINESSPTVVV